MAKTLAIVFGVVFVVVGLLGFVSNPIVGEMGLFVTNGLHNIVHLLVGVILLGVAFGSPMSSGMALKIFGIVYIILAVLGFVLPGDMLLGLVSVNMADHWLHLVLGVILFWAGTSMMKGKDMGMMGGSMGMGKM